MTLVEGQIQVRDLVMGCDTPYRLYGFDPWSRNARAEAGGERAWNHGAWSGAEWLAETVVPIQVYIGTEDRSTESWLELHQELVAAFEPVGELATDVELRFHIGGDEYVMFGRPRMVQIEQNSRPQRGRSHNRMAFVATDPRIYSGEEQMQVLGLPQFDGGLTVPLTVPFVVGGVLVDGRAEIENDGKAPTSLAVRIEGPVVAPRFTVQHPGGDVETLRVLFDLAAGQWLDIDTAAHTVILNGVASRRGQVAGDFPLLRPGTSTLRFNAAEFNDVAQLTARWRHAW